jgi:hypothetical protein
MRSYFAVPTDRTLDRIRTLMSSAPITLNFTRMVVPIALHVSGSDSSPFTPQEFLAKVTDFGHFYNEDLQHTQMVATLVSPSLVNRAIQLGAGEGYQPRWIIQNDATPLARTNKFWIVSVATILVTREHEPFTFEERMIDDA